MKRRCEFLDSSPHFNYNTGIGVPIQDGSGHILNTNTRQLGSTLMKIMIEEVNNFCDPSVMRNWSQKPHQQVWFCGFIDCLNRKTDNKATVIYLYADR